MTRWARVVIGVLVVLALSVLRASSAPPSAGPTAAVALSSAVAVRLASPDCLFHAGVTGTPIIPGWYEVDGEQAKSRLGACGEMFPVETLSVFDDGPQAAPSDPMISQQWHISKISAPAAWDTSHGDGVVIAILDTGVTCTHPDLAGKCVSAGRDFINNDDDASDDHGHGTHVAGIAAASTNNGIGGAGVGYNARVLPVKVLGANGSGPTTAIARGIDWASQQPGVRVINMSLGAELGHSDALMADAVNLARSRGVAVIAAAGNGATSTFTTPAAEAGVIGICATDPTDQRATFSNYGPNSKLCAPGAQILSTVKNGTYEAWSGTSMASPVAAGVMALAAAACPDCGLSELETRLLAGDPITTDRPTGGRRVNAARAVQAGSGPTLTPQPTFTPGPTPTTAPSLDDATEAEINRRRAQYNLPALITDGRLRAIAHQHNGVMDSQNCFAHECPGEPSLGTRLSSAGYRSGSEIIGRGCSTVTCMVNAWMDSDPHRAIILSDMTHIGCAFDDYSAGYYLGIFWTCDFGRSTANPQPTPIATPRPLPTSTPTRQPDNGLPDGWEMHIIIDYDRSSLSFVDAMYQEYCTGRYAVQGVTCQWTRSSRP